MKHMALFGSLVVATLSESFVFASPQVHMEGERFFLSESGNHRMREHFSRDVFFSTSRQGLVNMGSVERRQISRRQSSGWTQIAKISRQHIPVTLESLKILKLPLNNGEYGAKRGELFLEIRAEPCPMHKNHLMFLASIKDERSGIRTPIMAGALPTDGLEKEVDSLVKKFNTLLFQDRTSSQGSLKDIELLEKKDIAEERNIASKQPSIMSVGFSNENPESSSKSSSSAPSSSTSNTLSDFDVELLASSHPVLFWFLTIFTLLCFSILLVAFALLVRKLIYLITESRSNSVQQESYRSIPTYEEAVSIKDEKSGEKEKFLSQE